MNDVETRLVDDLMRLIGRGALEKWGRGIVVGGVYWHYGDRLYAIAELLQVQQIKIALVIDSLFR